MKPLLVKYYYYFLAALALIFIGISVFVYYLTGKDSVTEFDYMPYRLLRGVICFVYLIIITSFKKKESNKLISAFLFFYGASSIVTIWYENNFLATLSMGLNVLSFLSLIWAIFPKVNILKMDSFHILCLVVMLGINGFLGFQFIESFKEMTLSSLHFSFIAFNALGIVFLSYLSILYTHKYSTKNTMIFSGFIFLLLFTEVFRGVSYYDIAYGDLSAHIARALLIVSISFLVHYGFLAKTEEEALNSNLF
ncbi:MAG: hypothetical protein QM499_05075 [Flavobacteriaceae bacterium]